MRSSTFNVPLLWFIKMGGSLGLSVNLLLAQAQTVAGSEAPPLVSPSKTAAAVAPAFAYHSVFSHYQAFNDHSVASWSQTNEQVQKIGGWRAYAKESNQPEAGVVSTPTAPSFLNQHDKHGSKP